MVGLICEGGGMKCAYGAGVLDCFMEAGIKFDYVIGVSAGSANAITFVAGQHGRAKRFYTDHIDEHGYFGVSALLEEGSLFGLEYIYGDISTSGGSDPLDWDAIMANPARFECVATECTTGRAKYFSKDDIPRDDYHVIMASSAIPAISTPVRINGIEYCDGGVSDSIPVSRAFEMGCDKVVVILSKTRDYVCEPEGHHAIYSKMLKQYPALVTAIENRHLSYRECQRKMFGYEAQGKAFIFAVSRPVRTSTYKMDREINQAMYDLGRRDYTKQAGELKKFLGGTT